MSLDAAQPIFLQAINTLILFVVVGTVGAVQFFAEYARLAYISA
jgi:hypothetical protein